ncbi:MAG: polysaccharide biosynthesis/export family protein [Bdellovibrionales bacterium]
MFRLILLALLLIVFTSPRLSFASQDYVILPGDVLQVTVWKEEGLDQEIVVLPSGDFTFPLIGMVNAKGKTPTQLRNTILAKLKPFIQEPSVTVTVKAPLGHKASVIGEVNEPGDVLLSSQTSITQALSQVGGLTPYADSDDILVIRAGEDGTKEKIPFSFSQFSKGRDLDQDIALQPGDVIVVPASGLF